MNYEIVNLEEKIVVGITARTSNDDENMGNIIGGLWKDFHGKGIYNLIENKVNDKAVGIYSDYENNYMGKYNITVGAEVKEAENIPTESIIKVIPKGKYAKFIVRGHMQRAVSEFWNELWNMDLNRNYLCDFEEYQDCNEENAEIHIYISIN